MVFGGALVVRDPKGPSSLAAFGPIRRHAATTARAVRALCGHCAGTVRALHGHCAGVFCYVAPRGCSNCYRQTVCVVFLAHAATPELIRHPRAKARTTQLEEVCSLRPRDPKILVQCNSFEEWPYNEQPHMSLCSVSVRGAATPVPKKRKPAEALFRGPLYSGRLN